MQTERSFRACDMPSRCRVGEGLLPERSVGVKPEERRRIKLTYAWELRTMTDQGRQAAHRQYKPCAVVEFASGKSIHNRHS